MKRKKPRRAPTSATVNACNPDHYYGETPAISIVKKTNGTDNDAAPGPIVSVPGTWKIHGPVPVRVSVVESVASLVKQ